MSKKRSKPICVYCGVRIGGTRDHVPPKGLFARPRPELITVPCCYECREGQSLDDEYFLRTISMRDGTADNASARTARDSALRALSRPSKARFTSSLVRAMRNVALYSPSGIYLGQRTSYNVDLQRLCNVIERTTRGLYFREYGKRLPDDHRCKTYAIDGFEEASTEIVEQLRKLWEYVLSGTRRDFGIDVFTYWVRQLEGIEGATSWGFLVYGSVPFLAFTGPKDQTASH